MLPVTIWMNMPSHHQGALFRALAVRTDLRVIYDHPLTAERRSIGWEEEACSGYDFCVLPKNRKLREAIHIARSESNRLHIFGGIWAEPAFAAAIIARVSSGGRFAVYAETPTDRKLLGFESRSPARRVLRSVFAAWVARRATGFLAVSHFSADYYSQLGFTVDQLYPFGYFCTSRPTTLKVQTTDISEIIFVGKLDYRKGVDVLLDAILPLMARNCSLRLVFIGGGPEADRIERDVRACGLADRVTLEGIIPSTQIHDRLARADILVLPSRGDGWGMVVNEAFVAGIPVIASDRCGASDLIRHGVNGYVFRSEDVSDLRACLHAFLRADRERMRAAAVQTSSAIVIPVVADYLVACLEHMSGIRAERPTPPWLQGLPLEAGKMAQLSVN